MSRIAVGASVLLVVVCIAWSSSSQAQTEEQNTGSAVGTGFGVANPPINTQTVANERPLRPIRNTLRSKPLSTDYIEAALDSPLKSPLQFENQPFEDIVAHIAGEYSLPIVIDRMKFEEIAIYPDAKVTVDLKNVSLRSALNILLDQPGLEDTSFAVLNEVLTITTEEHCTDSLFVRVYPTEDFVYSNGPSPWPGGNWAEYSPLVDVIQNCVSPETWKENGQGEGEVLPMKPGLMIVLQEYRVHVEIEKLLNDLRTELRIMEQELGRDTLKETGRFYDRNSTPPTQRSGGFGGKSHGGGNF